MRYFGFITTIVMVFILAVILLLVFSASVVCPHEEMCKVFAFQFDGSTATSHIKPVCKNCSQYFEATRFRGTPNDLSYLEVVKEYIVEDEIVSGGYHTMTATVTIREHDTMRTRLNCSVGNEDIEVHFSVEFRGEFEEAVSALQIGEQITFRGRLDNTGFGWTDCELLSRRGVE